EAPRRGRGGRLHRALRGRGPVRRLVAAADRRGARHGRRALPDGVLREGKPAMTTEPVRKRLALAGTGHRGAGLWGRQLLRDLPGHVELVALADPNSRRLAAAQKAIGTNAPGYTDVRE